MIQALHHVQITVDPADVPAALDFYVNFLGLTENPKPDSLRGRGGFWLNVGDHAVHVGVEEGVARAATRAHIAYEVTNLEEWQKKLNTAAIPFKAGIPIPGYDRLEFRDPFGNRIELIARLPIQE